MLYLLQHVCSLMLMPVVVDKLVVGGLFALAPIPDAHDKPFQKALRTLASLLGAAMLLSHALHEVRTGEIIIEDVMPRQVCEESVRKLWQTGHLSL